MLTKKESQNVAVKSLKRSGRERETKHVRYGLARKSTFFPQLSSLSPCFTHRSYTLCTTCCSSHVSHPPPVITLSSEDEEADVNQVWPAATTTTAACNGGRRSRAGKTKVILRPKRRWTMIPRRQYQYKEALREMEVNNNNNDDGKGPLNDFEGIHGKDCNGHENLRRQGKGSGDDDGATTSVGGCSLGPSDQRQLVQDCDTSKEETHVWQPWKGRGEGRDEKPTTDQLERLPAAKNPQSSSIYSRCAYHFCC